ncbi:MAG: hypothetical protein FWG98_14400 [Candidatus Cloacimonetes bacterium]|nr:hypothetical protein [Candidatus Cloacimonadota bacterium]
MADRNSASLFASSKSLEPPHKCGGSVVIRRLLRENSKKEPRNDGKG